MRFLKKKDVSAKTTLAPAEVDRREAGGRFPPRLRLGDKFRCRVVWLESDVEEWMRDPINYRQPPKREALVELPRIIEAEFAILE